MTLVPLVVLALGIVAGGVERQHRTLPSSVLAVPRRGRLVLGKVLAVAPVGMVLTLAGLAIDLAVALPWLHGKGVSVELGATTWLLVVAGARLCALAATALGVAVGLLTPFPATGIVLAIGFVIVVEPIVVSRAHVVAEFLPGYAMDAAMRGLSTIGHHDVLPQAAGALVLAAWTAALLAGATRWLVRRDLV